MNATPSHLSIDDSMLDIGVDRAGIHQLANTGAANLITVRVYAPALMELTVYSTESPEVERRPLRYTLVEDLT